MPSRPGQERANGFLLFLFTLGVIGWGFFAIARLTDEPFLSDVRKNQRGENKKNLSLFGEWRHWLLEKVNAFSPPQRKWEVKNLAPAKIGKEEREETLPLIEDPISYGSFQEEARDATAQNHTDNPRKIYLYQLKSSGELTLRAVLRQNIDSPHEALEAVIRGPTPAEEARQFIDSFPHKPKIQSVQVKGDTLIIDFDESFGMGVSHSTLKYQLQQLFHTAREIAGIKAISLRIGGQRKPHIGGDGLVLPERIDEESLRHW
ncbi:MAG: GerMN domain-containing protein [Leptospiraceae bacterium]|nr:GerMN domain-containing protein [Leptospiraceae bacterium]MDW8305483.1 GerMN domain-containing protein [Leptospiraceae bacterium]